MRLSITSFWLECKRKLFTRSAFSFLLLAVLLGAGGAWLLNPTQQVLDIAVGLVYEPSDPYAALIAKELSAYQSIRFVQIPPDQLDDARRQVEGGALECAYVFPATLQADIAARKTTNLVSVIKSPSSLSDSLVSEWVFSAVLRASAADIVTGELSRIPQLASIDFEDDVRSGIAGWLLDEQYVTVSDEWAEAAVKEPLPIPAGTRPLHGIAALMVLLAALSVLPAYIGEKRRLCAILTTRQVLCYYAGVYAASFLRTLLVGCTSLGASFLLYPRVLSGTPLQELAALSLFCLAVTGLQLLLIALLPENASVFPLGSALILLCMLAGGTLLDPSELGESVVLLSRFLPTSYYLQHVLTTRTSSLLLLLSAAVPPVAFTLFVFIDKRKPHRL